MTLATQAMPLSWIYLSPHFDDVALSCGGLLWEQARRGESVGVWTLCAGNSPEAGLSPFAESLHQRWQTGAHAPELRRQEDLASCAVMGAGARHFDLPDCIYRTDREGRPLYTSEEAIFEPLHPLEAPLVEALSQELLSRMPEGVRLVSPLSVGGHVDHRLVRQVAVKAAAAAWLPLWFYVDYPYILKYADQLPGLVGSGWTTHSFPVSASGLSAWQNAIAAHASQISTFWPDLEAMREAIRQYCGQKDGVLLWRQELASSP